MHRLLKPYSYLFLLNDTAAFLSMFELHILMAQCEMSVNVPLGWLLCTSKHKVQFVAFESKFRPVTSGLKTPELFWLKFQRNGALFPCGL